DVIVRVVDNCAAANTGQRVGAQALPGGRFDQANVRIPIEGGTVAQCAAPPMITTATLPDGVLDQPYSFQLTSTGGEGNVSFGGTGLPSNLTIDTNGLI